MVVEKAVKMAEKMDVPIVARGEHELCPPALTAAKDLSLRPGQERRGRKASQSSPARQMPIDPKLAALVDAGKIEEFEAHG